MKAQKCAVWGNCKDFNFTSDNTHIERHFIFLEAPRSMMKNVAK